MKITFLGTRGYIDPKNKRHMQHTALLIHHKEKKIMIDCGENWRKKVLKVVPDCIILTHAHPDHAYGLSDKITCPIYATKKTWQLLNRLEVQKKFRKTIKERKKKKIFGLTFEAFPVIHSLLAPAVGYRITSGKTAFFYVPDVVWINDRSQAFKNIKFYIGDGATIRRNMIRKDKKTGQIFGHANIRQQLTWCKKEKVPKMIVTHCGSDIVGSKQKEKKAIHLIKKLAVERGVEVTLAYDGMEMLLRA